MNFLTHPSASLCTEREGGGCYKQRCMWQCFLYKESTPAAGPRKHNLEFSGPPWSLSDLEGVGYLYQSLVRFPVSISVSCLWTAWPLKNGWDPSSRLASEFWSLRSYCCQLLELRCSEQFSTVHTMFNINNYFSDHLNMQQRKEKVCATRWP